jgi:hypothetical protein
MKKLFFALLFCLAFVSTHAAKAQNIDPRQLNWSNSTGCSTVGQPYVPQSNTCVALGYVLTNPSGAQSIVQPSLANPLAINFAKLAIVNGIVMADQFCSTAIGSSTYGGITLPSCSADMCVKLLAANQYAAANGNGLIDATHFSGTQACSVNPFSSLNGTQNSSANITDNFGSVHIQTTAQWDIVNSGVRLRGMGPYNTQLEYTGSSVLGAILLVNGNNGAAGVYAGNGINNVEINGIFVYGDVVSSTTNATDAVDLDFVNRSKIEDLYTWGAATCGLRINAGVTDTLIRPHTSSSDATYVGIDSASHTTPSTGLCFAAGSGNSSGIQTTNGTVVDAMAEGLTGTGWQLISANSMTFTSGTSEYNNAGLLIYAASKYNNFLSPDLEGNTANYTGVDINDNGGYNSFYEPIASSTCSGSCNGSVQLTGAAGQDWIIGPMEGAAFTAYGAGVYGFNPADPGAGHSFTTTADGFMEMYVAGTLRYIPFFNTLP